MSTSGTVNSNPPQFPGTPAALDGTNAVVSVETDGGEAAGAYPITPASNMGEGWALAVASGKRNVFGRRLLFFEPEGEHAAAGVTAGMSMTGLRSANFSAAQGIAYMHESLYAAVGKRLTYVLNIACRAMTKQSLNIHCGHDDYHAADDTGFIQLFAKDVQSAADLNLIAHRVAEQALTPAMIAQDGFLTSHVIETMNLPERDLVREYLGNPADIIDCPTPAQRLMFGPTRRRIPELFDYDNPAQLGTVQNQDSYAQGVAAQRPFFFDHVQELADEAMKRYGEMTGRHYDRAVGYRTDDAEYLIVAQGSLVSNAEAVCDWVRETRDLKVGVVDMVMFRPFPADKVLELIQGKRGVTVLERVDQPLASDPPLLRELRTAVGKALENGRTSGDELPFPGLPRFKDADAPLFFSGCVGLGSRDTQPGDLVAAVTNMLPSGERRRQFYLGIEFVRDGAQGGLKTWQNEIVEAYPNIGGLALKAEPDVVIKPKGSLATRIHSIGGWGAITMGKNITMMLFDLLGLHVKSNPKYGSEKKGMPTTFFAAFAHEKIRLNCDLKQVDVVLSPDANVFSHSNPLAGLGEGGVFVIQTAEGPEKVWSDLPRWAQKTIIDKGIKAYCIDAFKIAREEASDIELQYRMQGNAFQGAFFKTSPLMERENVDEGALFEAIKSQLNKKFGHRGARVVEDNFRVIRRGFEEVIPIEAGELSDTAVAGKTLPWFHEPHASKRQFAGDVADPARFFEQTSQIYLDGQEPIADPFVALSAVPAATGVFRDMTMIRFDVPKFIPENCTGCGDCWTQCPDVAIPGLVSEIDDVLNAAIRAASNGGTGVELPAVVAALSQEARAVLKTQEFTGFAATLAAAYENVTGRMRLTQARRETLDREFSPVLSRLREFPLTKVSPFFDAPEARDAGSGGLLSITVNPFTCKGCMLCVEACDDEALIKIPQTDDEIDQLRRNWDMWQTLPDTPDRFVNVRDLDQGIGVLSTLLLKKDAYHALVGGDGACMGCGEKTVIHLALGAIESSIQPRVAAFVEKIEGLIAGLNDKARVLLTSSADLDALAADDTGQGVEVKVSPEARQAIGRIRTVVKALEDLHWRYTEGPTGRGRATLGMTNATGCSSVWGGTYPYNPYPYPWTNHLFQDAPSIAIGIFEGHMRKMADCFTAVRRGEAILDDTWSRQLDEDLSILDYRGFTDDEYRLCPPVVAVGGDGAMFDIGFQNLSRLLSSGKPLKVIVLDTQVYSNTGGQACTSGFFGQAADMAPYGAAQHGKIENRKELSYIAMAHRGAFVVQSSQASAAHLLGAVLKGMASRRPSIFVLHSPCMPEHGIQDDAAWKAAKMALEARVFPHFIYDPDAGDDLTERLDLDGNPLMDQKWPTYELKYLDNNDEPASMTLPVTVADWAASESRFRKHFRAARGITDNQVVFHEYLEMSPAEREGKIPFIYTLDANQHLSRVICAWEIVSLAEERIDFYKSLLLMGGVEVAPTVRDLVSDDLEEELAARLDALRAEYEAKLAELKASYPQQVANRIAEALIGGGSSADMLSALAGGATLPAPTVSGAPGLAPSENGGDGATAAAPEIVGEPAWIDQALCTACDDCMAVNKKIFAYNDDKKAVIKDPRGGPYKDIVLAAEKCPASCIHPGDPQNPKERGLEKWVQRAAPFSG